ncbi:hypothetical protein COR50_01535 [Chitinophaga caeni]|uniref:VOC domain-containing protein n=1 Tax=Chitinophaga caeni TaxID=2029983 RepID=A0A291QPT9_9BACT|nr:VOC family protein [Chitinophaga caeni]ATL45947.1 hypothetical protein COR50_01535 [Chitinophaga caeni]
MEIPKNSISWFEIPVKDFERARDFYSAIFQFELQEIKMGINRLGFFPVKAEGIGGAIVQGPDYISSQRGSLLYLTAEPDLLEVLDRIPDAGGKIELGKTPLSLDQQLGYFAIFYDTEGNRLALYSAG